MPSYTLPVDANNRPASGGYTPSLGIITLQTGTPTTDASNVTSAPLNVVLVPDAGTYKEQSSLSAGYQGAFLVPVTDVSAFKWWSLHITGSYNGTLAFLISNDGQNWDSYPAMQMNTPGVTATSVTNLTGVFGGPVLARYVQVKMVNYSSGIATGTLELYVMPPALPTAISPVGIKVDGSGVIQPVTGVITIAANQPAIPITGNITASNASVGITGATFPASATFLGASDGTNLKGLVVDASGNLKVNVAAGGASGGTSSSFNATFPGTGTAVGASDGTNMKALQVDASGYLKVNVAAGGASGGTSSSFTAAFPTTGTALGFTDGTNMQAGRVFDADSGAGTEYVQGMILRKSASGGSVEAATASNPLRTDPTGTTTQPVSGTVSITANSAVNVAQVGGTTTDTNSGNKSAGTQRVVLATDQPALTNALKVDGSAVTQPISGTITANAGTGTFTNQQSNITTDYDTGAGTQTMTLFGVALPASGGAVAGGTSSNPLRTDPTGTTTQPVSGTVSITANSSVNMAQVAGTTTDTNSGNKSAGTLRVVLATDQPQLTNALKVDGSAVTQPISGTVSVQHGNVVSTVNSSTSTLTANSVFTGTSESSLTYSAISVEVYADQNSASGGLVVQQSQDSSNWDTTDSFTITASTAFQTSVNLVGQYFRVKYTNGGTGQGTFRLQTVKQAAESVLPRALSASGNLKVAVQEALPTGSNTIGAVTQASGPWTSNVTQIGGSSLALGQTTMAASLPVTMASNQGNINVVVNAALPTGSNVIGALSANQSVNMAQVAGTTADTNSGNKSAGTLRVVLATDQPALTNALPVSQSGTWTVQPGNTANTTPWLTSPQVASSGGGIPYHTITAASTNFTNVKGSACQLYDVDLSNTSGSAIFVKFYDKATAPGTGDVPKRTLQVPANATVIRAYPNGLKFSTGFGWAATGAVGDADNTAIAANCVVDFSLNS